MLLVSKILAACLSTAFFNACQSHLHGTNLHHHDRRKLNNQRDIVTNSTTFTICGTKPPTDQEIALVTKALSTLSTESVDVQSTVVVDTFFHIVHDGATGNLTDEVVGSQIDVLNERYATVGFTFVLKGIDRSDNASWFYNLSDWVWDITSSLYQGNLSTLNIYSFDLSIYQTLGISNYPWELINEYEFLDGPFIEYSTLPGGSFPSYNLGINLVHQVGHWLGLFETFEGGCAKSSTAAGDFVSDTPAEAEPAFSCDDIGRDSCPDLTGLDPVTNYMDFTEDACKNMFTSGQQYRMHALWTLFRNDTPLPPVAVPTPSPSSTPFPTSVSPATISPTGSSSSIPTIYVTSAPSVVNVTAEPSAFLNVTAEPSASVNVTAEPSASVNISSLFSY